jgi:large subunit ribosomal protein L6
MSRVANAPIALPKGVDVARNGSLFTVKGSLGEMSLSVQDCVEVAVEDGQIRIQWNESAKNGKSLAGTTRAVLNNMVKGVSEGFVKKMQLVGVGYRAQVAGNVLTLSLGYSNPVEYILPEGVSAELPTQTEINLKGKDKQQIGQVAAEIRAFRPPEPYKGKGIRLADEYVARKEAKKK